MCKSIGKFNNIIYISKWLLSYKCSALMRKNYVCQKQFGTLTSFPHIHFRASERASHLVGFFLFVPTFFWLLLLPYYISLPIQRNGIIKDFSIVNTVHWALFFTPSASGFKRKFAFVAAQKISCHQFLFESFHNLCNAPCNEDREMVWQNFVLHIVTILPTSKLCAQCTDQCILHMYYKLHVSIIHTSTKQANRQSERW